MVGSQSSRLPVEAPEALSLRPNPEHALRIFKHGTDYRPTQAGLILFICAVVGEHLGPFVEPHQPLIRAQPENPLRVFQDGIDDVGPEAGRVCWIVSIYGERIAIVLVEPVLGADPQEPLAVLQDRVHAALG